MEHGAWSMKERRQIIKALIAGEKFVLPIIAINEMEVFTSWVGISFRRHILSDLCSCSARVCKHD